MLTINERRMGEAIILGLAGMLVVPDDDALLEAVSGCASNGGRLVVLDIGGLVRVDAGGLGALIRSRNLLASRDGELRLINPTGVVDELLRLTRLDSIIPTLRAEPDSQERPTAERFEHPLRRPPTLRGGAPRGTTGRHN